MKLPVPALFFVVSFVLSLCVLKAPNVIAEGNVVSNSEEIQVGKPYDFVFLAVFDTVNELSDWVPEQTLKADGLIRIRNNQFNRFDDSSRRIVEIRIRRDSITQTSVFLDPKSSGAIGASDVLEAIRKKLGVTAA